jgi:hypothetical protein
MRNRLPLGLLAVAFACSLFAAPAQAQRARTFVASYGNDSNPCTFLSPCRTFQQAVNVVADGGEVTAIDSAGFGPVSITQSVTITSPDGVEAGIVATPGSNAVIIEGPTTIEVVLRGLTIDGSSGGNNGIVYLSAGSLTVTNCVIKNFAAAAPNFFGNGILFLPEPLTGTPVNFVITNTIVANNGLVGIYYTPQEVATNTKGVIDHVTATGNANTGIAIDNSLSTGGTTSVTITNSVVSNNETGIYADNLTGGNNWVAIDNSTVSGNSNYGVDARRTAKVTLGRTLVTGNGNGVLNNTSGNTLYTYGNNQIELNFVDEPNALNTSFTPR